MRRRLPALVATGAALAISLTGCFGAEKSGGAAEGGSGGSSGTEQKPMSPLEVVAASAQKTKTADTFKSLFSMKIKTAEGNVAMKGRMAYRTKPDMAFDQNISSMQMGGRKLPGGMRQVLINDVIYMKMQMLSSMTGGKPWLKMSLADLEQKSGINVDQLMEQSQQMNPVTNTQMLTSSKDAKKVGTEEVGGVQTTHYTGTYDPEASMAKLDPKTREAAQKAMAGMKDMKFDLWVDDQQLPRKMVLRGKVASKETGAGSMAMTMLFSDFGEPVNISAPPASQTQDIKQMKGMRGGD
ncbi:MAG: LppX_LprAFG lipoprotein [Streptosporangiales bacterium]|nr:LppX_LprAFG lipoprotein [Streptosporangiales bacterium]